MIGLGTLMWGVTAASVMGSIANIKKLQIGFMIWSCTNAAWMVYSLYKVEYATAALFFANMIFALWGVYEWRPTS